MKIIVEMTSEEFREFMDWKDDKSVYERELGEVHKNADRIVDKVFLALEPDPKDGTQVVVADQDHLAELYDMALEW